MLINCPECKLQISDKALTCPHCGCPMNLNIASQKRRSTRKRMRLPNGFGSITEIKNKKLRKPFRVRVCVGKTSEGKPILKALKPESMFETYNDAYAALVEYNRNPYDLDDDLRVSELYERWTAAYFPTLAGPSSARTLTSAWAYCSSIYDMRAKDVRPRHIKGCMEEGVATVRGQEQTPSASMKNKIKTLFNQMLDYAVEYELVDRNYSRTFKLTDDTIKEIQTVKKEHIPFSDDEMALLWKNLGHKYGIEFMIIQCYSGWRPQELGLIELADVDLSNWTFKGGIKTDAGENRVVPIHPRIRDLVSKSYEEAEQLGSKYLFNYTDEDRRGKNTKLTYNRYSKIFNRIRDELKLNPDHRPHDGRKHFVTKCNTLSNIWSDIRFQISPKRCIQPENLNGSELK